LLKISNFWKLAVQMIPFINQIWAHYNQLVLTKLVDVNTDTNEEFKSILLNSKYCGRVMMNLLCGLKTMNHCQNDINSFMGSMLQMLTKLVEFRNECINRKLKPKTLESIETTLIFTIKIPTRIQHVHPLLSPQPHLALFLQLTLTLLTFPQPQPDRLIWSSFQFLQHVIENNKFSSVRNDANDRVASQDVRDQVFTNDVCSTLVKCLLGRYMIMSEDDLLMWEEEPENFVKDQELDSSETIKVG
jgi:hypothetical protein